jgi:N-acetylmuramoyl-L-alanine amidase
MQDKGNQMKFLASLNFNARAEGTTIDYIVLHYTVLNAEESLAKMRDPSCEVSAHYMICEDGEMIQLVDEASRAWHAGESMWKKQDDINSRSIGIELVNDGQSPFPAPQIDSLKKLVRDIMKRHGLGRDCLLAHSDIAPTRKCDPGVFFPWKELADEGLGYFPSPKQTDGTPPYEGEATKLLEAIGYDVTDERAALTAFQRRYRPTKVDGQADTETLACLRSYQQ